jgi:hypothetical protein
MLQNSGQEAVSLDLRRGSRHLLIQEPGDRRLEIRRAKPEDAGDPLVDRRTHDRQQEVHEYQANGDVKRDKRFHMRGPSARVTSGPRRDLYVGIMDGRSGRILNIDRSTVNNKPWPSQNFPSSRPSVGFGRASLLTVFGGAVIQPKELAVASVLTSHRTTNLAGFVTCAYHRRLWTSESWLN